jgi:hypothetical protein
MVTTRARTQAAFYLTGANLCGLMGHRTLTNLCGIGLITFSPAHSEMGATL